MQDQNDPQDYVLATAVALTADEASILLAALAALAVGIGDPEAVPYLGRLGARFVTVARAAGSYPTDLDAPEDLVSFIRDADYADVSGLVPFLARREDLGDIVDEVDFIVVGVGE